MRILSLFGRTEIIACNVRRTVRSDLSAVGFSRENKGFMVGSQCILDVFSVCLRVWMGVCNQLTLKVALAMTMSARHVRYD